MNPPAPGGGRLRGEEPPNESGTGAAASLRTTAQPRSEKPPAESALRLQRAYRRPIGLKPAPVPRLEKSLNDLSPISRAGAGAGCEKLQCLCERPRAPSAQQRASSARASASHESIQSIRILRVASTVALP